MVGNDDGLFFLKGDIFKAVDIDEFEVGFFPDGAGYATGIHFGGFLDLLGKSADQDDIGDAEMSSGFEDAEHFLDDAVFVGDEVEDAIADDDVGDVGGDGHFFDVALPEFYVVVAELFGVGAGFVDHGGGEVDADDFAGVSGFGPGDEAVVAGAGAQVDDDVAFFDFGELGGEAAAEAQVGVGVVAFEVAVVVGHDVVYFGGAAAGTAAGGLVVFFVL